MACRTTPSRLRFFVFIFFLVTIATIYIYERHYRAAQFLSNEEYDIQPCVASSKLQMNKRSLAYSYQRHFGKPFNLTSEGLDFLWSYLGSPPITPVQLKEKIESGESPQFVVAASDNHFDESLLLIAEFRKVFGARPLVYYSLGLHESLLKTLKAAHYQPLTIRHLEDLKLPPHVNILFNYAWKILVIADALRHYQFITYMDASVRIVVNSTTFQSRIQEMVLTKHLPFSFCIPATGHTIAAATFSGTIEYLASNMKQLMKTECQQATSMTIADTYAVKWHVMKWAISCALTEDCIASDNTRAMVCPSSVWSRKSTGVCHRYDQSVINILVHNCWGHNKTYVNYLTNVAIRVA